MSPVIGLGSDLQGQPGQVRLRVIVCQEVERHRGNFRQHFVERRGIRCGRDVVAMPTPDRRLRVLGGGNREDDRLGHEHS